MESVLSHEWEMEGVAVCLGNLVYSWYRTLVSITMVMETGIDIHLPRNSSLDMHYLSGKFKWSNHSRQFLIF